MKRQADCSTDEKIGERLRAWRKQIGANQTRLAEIGGVSLNSQHRYEAGALPPTEYLLRIGEAGADWYWIVTGTQRSSNTLTAEAQDMVEAFMALPAPIQATLLDHARGLAKAVSSKNDA